MIGDRGGICYNVDRNDELEVFRTLTVRKGGICVMLFMVCRLGFAVTLCTFAIIVYNFFDLRRHDEGTAKMAELAATIRSGSKTFLRREYRSIAFAVVAIAVSFSLIQETWSGVCLLGAALLILVAEEIGMRAGTYGNVRTTNAARVTRALSRALRIATLGGSISGFSVVVSVLFGFIPLTVYCWIQGPTNMGSGFLMPNMLTNVMGARLLAFSLGFSIIAIFNRVAGGTYTKSADIGNDLVSKSEFGLEEDDPRNICSIADLIGDCLNDLAGNLSDLGESYAATLMSSVVVGIQSFDYNIGHLELVIAFPILLATAGLIASVISVMYIILKNKKRYRWTLLAEVLEAKKNGTITEDMLEALEQNVVRNTKNGTELRIEYSLEIEDPEAELTKATIVAAVITVIIGIFGAYVLFCNTRIESFRFSWASPMIAAILGIICSVVVGVLTGVYTDTKHSFVRKIAESAKEGAPFPLLGGLALGNHSAFYPMILIGISIIAAYICCGYYGIAIAAVGVLSFVGETVSIDAFGPIADNAGGIAEGCDLDPKFRRITDALDASGNTTAAIGKGNAISAASYSTIAMITAFIGVVPMLDLNSPDTLVGMIGGLFFGAAVIREFLSRLNTNTLAIAYKLTAEAERQLRIPGVMERTIKPDYNTAIRMAGDNSIMCMYKSVVLPVLSPLVVGALMGPAAQLGLLIGATSLAVGEAFVNGNAGGAYDNAKKMIEMGMIEGAEKHSPAHIATIICDMVGDIMKDVLAVNCDICIKIMAVVSTASALMFYHYNLLHFFIK
ncbi:sodium/proton-translocating pyrophosphatase [Candidatus Saccharibacteria bacterium]|nr:sodium/proton-translocating pyrophosphatase [Candidatus Saccharibacteria bacterium]